MIVDVQPAACIVARAPRTSDARCRQSGSTRPDTSGDCVAGESEAGAVGAVPRGLQSSSGNGSSRRLVQCRGVPVTSRTSASDRNRRSAGGSAQLHAAPRLPAEDGCSPSPLARDETVRTVRQIAQYDPLDLPRAQAQPFTGTAWFLRQNETSLLAERRHLNSGLEI